MCQIEIVREVGPSQVLKRCRTHGIAFVADGQTGTAASAHPNIDRSGSVASMVKKGWWSKADKTVRCHGFIYNVSHRVGSDRLTHLAADACQCGGVH